MNREIKVAMGLLLCLVGLILFLELSDKNTEGLDTEILSEVESTPAKAPSPDENREPLATIKEESPFQPADVISEPVEPIEIKESQVTARVKSENLQASPSNNDTTAETLVSTEPKKQDLSSGSIPKEIPETYTVKKGDKLSLIAERILGSSKYTKLIIYNNPELDPDQIYPGIELVMPKAEELEASGPVTVQESVNGDKVYPVRKGDTLYSISRKVFGDSSKVKDILRLNPEVDPDKLVVGHNLVLPPQ